MGDHITQKGSLVAPDKLRFDISHPKGMTAEEISAAEREVNRIIWQNKEVSTRLMTPDEAVKNGAMALFGEKYGDEVRVLSMGIDDDKPYSVELCGGTHVTATGDIGLFKITSEAAVAAGIRRIEAVTRDGAFAYLNKQEAVVKDLGRAFKSDAQGLAGFILAMDNERKKLVKELGEAKKLLALGGGGSSTTEVETVGNVTFMGKIFDGLDPKDLRGVADDFLKSADIAVVATQVEGKASVVVAVSKAHSASISAVDLVKEAVAILGGKGGGGRPEMAQGGGPDADKLDAALVAVKAKLA